MKDKKKIRYRNGVGNCNWNCIGVALDNIAIWVAIGVALGAGIGNMLNNKKKIEDKN